MWIRPRLFTISLGAHSSASCSCASTALRLAHERVCASPCPPTHILPFADRSIYEIGYLLTGQRLPSEPPCALSASRASHLHVPMWSVVCTCTRGSDCLALVARAVRGVMLRSWALVMCPRRARPVVCGMLYAAAVLASEVARCAIAHSSACRPDWCRWPRLRARGAMWGTV